MKVWRRILLGLLVVPVALLILVMARPGALTELAFLLVGVPILAWNAWDFLTGEAKSSFFDIPDQKPLKAAGQEGVLMRYKWIIALVILVSLFVLLVIGYTAARAAVDDVPYSTALFAFLTKLGVKLWAFFSKPVIFIGALFFALALVAGSWFLPRLWKPAAAASAKLSDVFQKPISGSMSETGMQALPSESLALLAEDRQTIQLLLEMDGLDLTRAYLLSKMQSLDVRAEGLPAEASPAQKEAYYQGLLEGFYQSLFPLNCKIETKSDGKVARFTLKDGYRQKLMEMLNAGQPAETAGLP